MSQKIIKISRCFTVAACVFLTFACASVQEKGDERTNSVKKNTISSDDPKYIDGHSWTLKTLASIAITLDVISRPRIELDTVQGEVQGYTGCNSFKGKVDIGKGTVQFLPMMMTRRACPESTQLENQFIQVLDASENWEISKGEFILRDKDQQVLATFQ